MPEYHPPLADRKLLRLDFNENTFAPSPRVAEVLKSITLESLTIYPEREPVERKVAAHLNLSPAELLLTNAVDEAIHLICFTFLEEGDEAIVATPSFFMYDVNIASMGAKLTRIQADDSLTFPFERMLAAVNPKTKLIILASPNNPTGATTTRVQIHAFAKAAPQAVIFVDEAYYHFHGETALGDFRDIPNILVARTFSKAYGLASLRIGIIAANSALIAHLRKAASPYNVNGVALRVLEAAIEDDEYVDWYTSQILNGRVRLEAALTELQIPHWPSAANFILTRIGPRHKEFVSTVRTHGVLLRDRSSDPGLEGCVRVTVGVENQVTKGIEAIRASIAEIAWTPSETTAPNSSPKEDREYE